MLNDYLMINESTNIVENISTWDGNPNTWQPPANTLMLIKDITPAMVWQLDTTSVLPSYVLAEQIGQSEIGFTWNGTACVTNEPQPTMPTPSENQPNAEGFTTI